MVSLKAIQQANKSCSSSPKTAVFVGATSGIGLGAIEALLKHTKGSTIFIVGRSEKKFSDKLSRLQSIDATATITFLEAQVSLLSEIYRVCTTLLKQVRSLDLLWLSQGGLGLREGSGPTAEGLPVDFAVVHYGRVLFMMQLSPLLCKSRDGRVVSVLCAGFEGSINLADPGLRDQSNYDKAGFWGAQKQGITMQSLSMRQLANQYPSVSFIHTNPGMVSTDVHAKWSATFSGWWTPISWLLTLVTPLLHMVGFTPEQAGEIGLFELLNDRFGARAGVNFHRLDHNAEEIATDQPAVLSKYEGDSTTEKIWEHTVRVFEDVLAS